MRVKERKRERKGSQPRESREKNQGELGGGDLCLVLAPLALKLVLVQIGNGNEATEVANVDSIGVRALKETLLEELSRTMRNNTAIEERE